MMNGVLKKTSWPPETMMSKKSAVFTTWQRYSQMLNTFHNKNLQKNALKT